MGERAGTDGKCREIGGEKGIREERINWWRKDQ
jgi:hypothetical protein